MSQNNSWVLELLLWMGVTLAISIGLSILLPFYISLPVMIVVFLALSYFVRRRAMARAGMTSSSFFGSSTTINYYCMTCGHKHSRPACPKCGSRMKKAGF